MSGFSKILPEQNSNCLIPVPSPAFEISYDDCDCCCHGHHYELGDPSQPATDTPVSGAEQKHQLEFTEDNKALKNMSADEVIARVELETTKKRAERVRRLENRLSEIHEIMALEKRLHSEWRASVKEKFEEVEDLKKALLAKLKLKAKIQALSESYTPKQGSIIPGQLETITGKFILTLMGSDFDHEIEDVWGAGKRIFRTFSEGALGDGWTGSEDVLIRMGRKGRKERCS